MSLLGADPTVLKEPFNAQSCENIPFIDDDDDDLGGSIDREVRGEEGSCGALYTLFRYAFPMREFDVMIFVLNAQIYALNDMCVFFLTFITDFLLVM